MKNILVPVDLSPVSGRLVDHAASIARAFGAKLWVIHVAAPDPDFVGFKTGPQYVRGQRAEVLRQEHVDLQQLAERQRIGGINAEALLVQGPTTATILDEVARLRADMIVMGSHGHSGLFASLMGNVCTQVLEETTVPMLIVPVRENA